MTPAVVTIIVLDLLHPPTLSTAIGFGFFARRQDVIDLYFIVLLLIASLVNVQRSIV